MELERETEAGIDGRAYDAFYKAGEGVERMEGRWSPVAQWVLLRATVFEHGSSTE
jgi:hypothetical protein